MGLITGSMQGCKCRAADWLTVIMIKTLVTNQVVLLHSINTGQFVFVGVVAKAVAWNMYYKQNAFSSAKKESRKKNSSDWLASK